MLRPRPPREPPPPLRTRKRISRKRTKTTDEDIRQSARIKDEQSAGIEVPVERPSCTTGEFLGQLVTLASSARQALENKGNELAAEKENPSSLQSCSGQTVLFLKRLTPAQVQTAGQLLASVGITISGVVQINTPDTVSNTNPPAAVSASDLIPPTIP